MPEGHTIHRLARHHRSDLAGRPISAVAGQERFAAGADRLDHKVLTSVEAWGKHLFHHFDTGDVLHVHLGLIGKWLRRSVDEDGVLAPNTATTRLRLATNDVAWDLTGPMACEIVTPSERDAVVSLLGPDPLRRGADPERMWARLQRSTRPVGLLLMDQDVVAGIGNVFRSELLNIVGIDPRRPAGEVTRQEFEALWAETVRQLRLGLRRGRIVTMDAAELPRPLKRLLPGEGRYAYKQEVCGRCHTTLETFPLAGRTTWRCPACQPL